MFSKTWVRLALSVAVAAALLAVLLRWGGTSIGDVRAALARLSFGTWLLALGLHIAIYLLRAVRFSMLTPPQWRVGFMRTLSVVGAYTLAGFTLPARVGEVSYIGYSAAVGHAPASVSLAALVVTRLLDLATLALSMGVACLVLAVNGSRTAWFPAVGAALCVGSALLFVLCMRGDVLVRVAAWISRTAALESFALRIDGLAGALRDAGAHGRLWRAGFVSLATWACVFLFCAVLARGLGLGGEIGLAGATFGSGLAMVTSMLPVSAFANFGTLEAGWVLGFGVLGVPRELALATGTGLHLVQLVNVIVLGVLGHVGLALFGRTARR